MNWIKTISISGATTYKNDQYKIILGRFPLIGGYWFWRGYKYINGEYKFICDYSYSEFDSPDRFTKQIDYEYRLQEQTKEYKRQLWIRIKKSPIK